MLKIIKNKLFKKYLIPLFLFLSAVGVIGYIATRGSISVISYIHSGKIETKEIYKGDVISGRFKSKDNYLGTVGVRFDTQERINDDVLEFRIKEVGNNDWFYIGHYNTDQFQPDQLFPFGFPIVEDSKGKEYLFEMESLSGRESEMVRVSFTKPQFASDHQYPKAYIFGSSKQTMIFLGNKLYSLFTNPQFLLQSLVSFLPLIFYLLWLYKPELFQVTKTEQYNNLKSYLVKYPFLTGFILLLYVLIFIMISDISIFLVMIIGIAVFLSHMYKLGSTGLYILAFYSLLICPILVYFNIVKPAETAALFTFSFLTTGVVYSYIELRKNGTSSI